MILSRKVMEEKQEEQNNLVKKVIKIIKDNENYKYNKKFKDHVYNIKMMEKMTFSYNEELYNAVGKALKYVELYNKEK